MATVSFTFEDARAGTGGLPPYPPGWAALGPAGDAGALRSAWLAQEERFARYGRSRHFVELRRARPTAGLSVFLNDRANNGERVATFGFPFLTDASLPDCLEPILARASAWAREAGASLLRGPIAYSTWYPNRFRCSEVQPGRFPGELAHAASLPGWFVDLGFREAQRYFSVVSEPADRFAGRIESVVRFVRDKGVAFERLEGSAIATIFAETHALSLRAFAPNFGFTPIDRDEFDALHAPALALPGARAVAARDSAGMLVGFVFGFEAAGFRFEPDPKARVAVLKSIATDPARADLMAGPALSATFHRWCAEQGCSRVIHALMAKEQYAIGKATATVSPLCEYVLLERDLAAGPPEKRAPGGSGVEAE